MSATVILLAGIGTVLFGLLCVLLAMQVDLAAIRQVVIGKSMRDDAEAVEAYNRGVADGRNREAEER